MFTNDGNGQMVIAFLTDSIFRRLTSFEQSFSVVQSEMAMGNKYLNSKATFNKLFQFFYSTRFMVGAKS
jgi:hypothetical protein